MVRPKTYHDRTSTSVSFEKQLLNEFNELCVKERKTLSEKIGELVQEQLEKNAVGISNPIGLRYVKEIDSKNTLDYYIDNNFVTSKQFMNEFKTRDNQTVERFAALGRTINIAAEQVIYFNKTGKYLIR